MVAVTAAVLATMLAAGCGPSDSDDGDERPPASGSETPTDASAGPSPTPAAPTATAPTTAGPAPTTAGPTPASSPAPAETLVRAGRSGGYAGQTHTLVVKGDGSWTRLGPQTEPEGTGKLPEAGLAALRTALAEADFARLPRMATGDTTVYDGFTYAFVHGGFEVAAEQEALAPALRKVLDALPPFTP
ncbi:hypothetical protein BGK67_22315 [Streptomyces subrutilus]|uniref:Uncharacterized protein n=1 Tax=Streptomyces subrutilus TaxID=36818 RepID=A0A1E5PVZ1_9ACTN|nr:hypothetical protein BGK67_22315 [Streptomyces subrutilus]